MSLSRWMLAEEWMLAEALFAFVYAPRRLPLQWKT